MKNKKTKVLLIITIIIIILIIILSIIKSKPDNRAKRLTDQKTFFSINNLINDVEMQKQSMSTFYTTTSIYYKEFNKYIAYFINGFVTSNDMETTYKTNVNYLLKTEGIIYELDSIDTNNIVEYANNYDVKESNINSNETIPSFSFNEKNKLVYYLMAFNNMLYANPDEAYNYLSNNQKNKYNDINLFKNRIPAISKLIASRVNNYTSKENQDEIIYTINTDSGIITIIENGVMNIKIEY